MKVFKHLYHTLLILSLSFMLIACSNASNSENTEKAKQTAIELMNKSYDQDFAVKSIKYSSSTQSYELEMYPKDQPSYVFPVVLDAPTQSIKFNTYDPNYQKQVLFEQKYIIKPFASRGFTDFIITSVGGVIGADPRQQGSETILDAIHRVNSAINAQPTLIDALKKYHNEMSFGVTIKINTQLTPENILKILEASYQIQQLIASYDLNYINMNIYIYTLPKGITMAEFDKNPRNGYWANPKYTKETDAGMFDMKASMLYRINRKFDQLPVISSPLDMAHFFSMVDGKRAHSWSDLNTLPIFEKVKALYAQQHDH